MSVPGPPCTMNDTMHHRSHNPDIAPGKTIVVGTQEGLFARAHRDNERRVRGRERETIPRE